MLKRAELGEFVAEFVKFSMTLGFFLWLFTNGPGFAISIIESLTAVGSSASGTNSLSPDQIVRIAFNVFGNAFASFEFFSPIQSLALFLVAGVVLLLLLDTAITFLLIQISGLITVYAGIFILGFGGSRWTSDMAINYYKTILGIAVQLMVAILIISIGVNLLGTYRGMLSQGSLTYEDITVLLIVAFVLRSIVTKVPSMVAGMITSATGGQTIAAGSAAGVAAAAAAFGGGALLAAKQAAGGGSAVIAAVKAANAADAASGGVLAAMRNISEPPPSRSSGDNRSSSTSSGGASGGRAASASDAASKPITGSASQSFNDAPKSAAASAGSSGSQSSSSSPGASAAAGADDSQDRSQESDTSNSSGQSGFGSQAAANSSFDSQGSSAGSGGSSNSEAPGGSAASSSSAASAQDAAQGGSSSPSQSLDSSSGSSKPWEVADGQVPQEDISRMSASPEPGSSAAAAAQSTQEPSDAPGSASSESSPAAASSGSRFGRVAMATVKHLAGAGMDAVKADIAKNTAGGRLAARIGKSEERRQRDLKRAEQNLNIIAAAGPEFRAAVDEMSKSSYYKVTPGDQLPSQRENRGG